MTKQELIDQFNYLTRPMTDVKVSFSQFDGMRDFGVEGEGFYLRAHINLQGKAEFTNTSQCSSYTYAYLLLNFRIAVDEYNLV